MMTGRSRTGQQGRGGIERVTVGSDGGGLLGQRPGSAGVVGLAKDVIHREVDERHPRRRGHRGPQRVVDQPAHRVGRLGRRREPRQRCHERHMVDLLQ